MTLREEINELIAEAQLQPTSNWDDRTNNYLIDKFLKLIEKRIDEIQDIKNLKPAESPQDVIYNAGVYDGIGKVKEILK